MKLKLFSHTVTATAKAWLVSHTASTFDTWEKLAATFLAEYNLEMMSYKARC